MSRPSEHQTQLSIPHVPLDDILRLRELRRTVIRELNARAGEPGGGGRERGGVVVDLALAGFVDELEDGGEGISLDVGGEGAHGGGCALGSLTSGRERYISHYKYDSYDAGYRRKAYRAAEALEKRQRR